MHEMIELTFTGWRGPENSVQDWRHEPPRYFGKRFVSFPHDILASDARPLTQSVCTSASPYRPSSSGRCHCFTDEKPTHLQPLL
jgi:hypothetical protein